jgi:hypothetical protein
LDPRAIRPFGSRSADFGNEGHTAVRGKNSSFLVVAAMVVASAIVGGTSRPATAKPELAQKDRQTLRCLSCQLGRWWPAQARRREIQDYRIARLAARAVFDRRNPSSAIVGLHRAEARCAVLLIQHQQDIDDVDLRLLQVAANFPHVPTE